MDLRLRLHGFRVYAPAGDKEVAPPGQRPIVVGSRAAEVWSLSLPMQIHRLLWRRHVIRGPGGDSFRGPRKLNRRVSPTRRSICPITAPSRLQAREPAETQLPLSPSASWPKASWHLFIRLPRERKAGAKMSEW